MITGSLSGDIQYFKTLIFGDYKFVRYVNLRYRGEKITFPMLCSDAYLKKAFNSDDYPNCVICSSPFKYIFQKNNKTFAIFCNSALLTDLNDEEQKAVILHEIGHFVRGHLNTENRKESSEYQLEHEFEADAFACQQGYARALVNSLGKTVPPGYDNEEIRLRIRKIREDFAA